MTETDLQLGGGYTYQWECAILLALNYFFEPVRYNPTLFDLVNDFLGQVAEIHLEGRDQESGLNLEDINLANGDRRILIQVKAKQAEGKRWTSRDRLLHKALYRFYESRFFTQQPHTARFVFLTNRPFNRALVQVKFAIEKDALDQCTEADKLHRYLADYAKREKETTIDISRFREMLARTALVEYLGVDEIKANIQAKLQAYALRDWKQAHTVLFEHFARQSTSVGGGTVTRVSLDKVLGLQRRVQIFLHGDFSSFGEKRQGAVVDALAGLLQVSPHAIQVYSVKGGSVVFELGVPLDATERLRRLVQFNDARLHQLSIEKVILETVPDKVETWALVAGRLRLVGEPGYGPFLVPFHHNPDFVGREEDLAQLHKMVYQGESPVGIRPTVLVGLGGIGKTQLAVEYAHAHRDDYPGGVFWLNAVNPLLHELADLAETLGLADKETPRNQAVRRAWAYLDAHPDALVVFDNVIEPANLNIPFAPGLIPANLCCGTLFTTRQRDLPRNFRPFEVKVLPEMAAMQLLLRARPEVLDEHHPQRCVARLVCASLGWLPLALELAAAYLGKYPVTLDGYLERLRTEGRLATVDDTDLRQEDLPTRHVAAVEATLRTHWSRLDKEKDNDARLIFRAAGRLPEGTWIPVAWLGLLAGVEAEARPGRPAPLTRALIRLQEVSLILELADDRLRLHPLVHDFAAELTPKDERKAFVVELASNTVNSLKDPTRRNKWALIVSECLLALGWNDLSTEIHKPVLNALLELVHGNGVHERQRWTAASLLTRMGWLSDLKDVPASNVQDTTLEEFLAYLDIFDNFIFGEGECDAVVQIIDRILGTMSSESVGVKQAQMLVYRAIMNGKMGERLGSIDLLDASARDYQKVRDALDKLAEEGQPDMQKTLAQARLGAANIAMVRAEHLKDPKAVLEQRQEAVRLYKEANESAQACGDRLLQVSIFGELSHALALLQEWKDAEQAYSNALEILDELEVENPNAYANDRAWVFVTAGDTHLRKGLKLNDQVEFEKGYTKAEEAIELLQHIALGKFDISLLDAHITAADCAWAESKRLKGAPASSARARAEAHWKSAHEIARQLGEEDIVAEQSIFYNRR